MIDTSTIIITTQSLKIQFIDYENLIINSVCIFMADIKQRLLSLNLIKFKQQNTQNKYID